MVRPPWVFDVVEQGEGITDVTTHLVDIAQWITGGGGAFDYDRDVELLSARQWPTEVPLSMFTRITGLENFPGTLRHRVANGVLSYLCNAAMNFRLRGTSVAIQSRWALAVPEGGGDTHYAVVCGTAADLIVEHSGRTNYVTDLTVRPVDGGAGYAAAIGNAIDRFSVHPGRGDEACREFPITIRMALRTRTAALRKVLDRFLGHIEGRELSDNYYATW